MSKLQRPPGGLVDQLCAQHGLIKPSRRNMIIKSAPRVGQYFWIDFPHDAYSPEFVGEHPGIVVRSAKAIHDTCIVVPITSTEQTPSRHVHLLEKNPNPDRPELRVWAVCNHLYTVHNARLRPVWNGRAGRYDHIRVGQLDMDAVFACIRSALHHIFPVPGNASERSDR